MGLDVQLIPAHRDCISTDLVHRGDQSDRNSHVLALNDFVDCTKSKRFASITTVFLNRSPLRIKNVHSIILRNTCVSDWKHLACVLD